jgi:hypothetical protein
LAVERVVEVAAVHADQPFPGAERCQPLDREAVVADEQPTRPNRFLLQFSVEDMKVGSEKSST